MLVYGFPGEGLRSLEAIAAMIGLQLVEPKPKGKAWQFSIRRYTPKAKIACWFCHGQFFDRLFQLQAESRVVTGLARYDNAGEFRRAMRHAPPLTCECGGMHHGGNARS